ncbi:hypothetical protein Fmac_009249 [Flemingia macrophylla]|uniref:cyclin-dependent kinase n=1 Tax=Flemingia macrophylla TaxID=520843 RepID=A0ABD1MZS6_9FABA
MRLHPRFPSSAYDFSSLHDRMKLILYLIFECSSTPTAKALILGPSLIQSFLFQLCKGVTHRHSHGVLHRDLMPHNLLLDHHKGILKIVDLDLDRAFTVPLKSYTHMHKIVTLWYRALKVLLGSTHYSLL